MTAAGGAGLGVLGCVDPGEDIMVTRDNRWGIGSMGKLAAGGGLIALLLGSATCLGPSVGDGQVACGAGGVCPPGYACGGDGRCYRDPATAPDGAPAPDAAMVRCGDGVIGAGETCDPISSCPTDCSDGNACTRDTMTGGAATCDTVCVRSYVETCLAERDGCCPGGCTGDTLDVRYYDADCSTSCGDGVVDPGESCDPPNTCPAQCDDGNPCTADTLTGSAQNCNAACSFVVVTACGASEGCCPAGCDSTSDLDCSSSCGNGRVEAGELCDPPSSCPATCDDGNACTKDLSTGAASTCNLACTVTPVTCGGGDGCCSAGCTANDDSDCPPVCGNGVLESGETCDPPAGPCCDDGNACTSDYMDDSGSPCAPVCLNQPIDVCGMLDSCCPASCWSSSQSADADCQCPCGVSDGCCPAMNTSCTYDPDCGLTPLPIS